MSDRRSRLFHTGRGARRAALLAGACAALASAMIAAGAAQAATLPTVTATVSPTSISVTGALQAGAVNIASTATGGKEPAVVLFALKPGVTPTEFFAFLDSNKASGDPNNATKSGSIVFDSEPGKGKANEAQVVLTPGQYVAFNAEGEKSSKWPRTTFTVAASPSPAALPAPVATERTIDFDFDGPSVLRVGELVRFENEGFLVHMDIAIPARSKKGAQKIATALRTGHEKGIEKLAAGEPVTFAGPLSTSAFQQETITAKPGWYVQACFMMTQDGRIHTLLGMERVIRITK
jgi:hypothetical protein